MYEIIEKVNKEAVAMVDEEVLAGLHRDQVSVKSWQKTNKLAKLCESIYQGVGGKLFTGYVQWIENNFAMFQNFTIDIFQNFLYKYEYLKMLISIFQWFPHNPSLYHS